MVGYDRNLKDKAPGWTIPDHMKKARWDTGLEGGKSQAGAIYMGLLGLLARIGAVLVSCTWTADPLHVPPSQVLNAHGFQWMNASPSPTASEGSPRREPRRHGWLPRTAGVSAEGTRGQFDIGRLPGGRAPTLFIAGLYGQPLSTSCAQT